MEDSSNNREADDAETSGATNRLCLVFTILIYVVEFQKRGLPHVHLLIWLNSESKKNLTNNVDKYVFGELPNPETDPVGYAAVQSYMIHGPCGIDNPKCACMKEFKCMKHFPKKYGHREKGGNRLAVFCIHITVPYRTFKDACRYYGLLDDDNDWHEVLSDAAKSVFPVQIHHLFVHIIVNCQVTDIRHLWNEHWKNMIDDIILGRRDISGGLKSILNEKQLKFYALAEHFKQLPIPPRSYLQTGLNNLVIDKTSYNMSKMATEFDKLFPKCYPDQLHIYNAVFQSVKENAGGLFFAYGSGGCGKTFLWKTLIYKLRSMVLIVLPVASSGIAATLLPGGRTSHSRFKISIILDDYSSCGIGHDSNITELIKCTSLIIWDEAPMQHRYAFECLDRSLRDIMRSVHPSKYEPPFGGITVLLGGDFRQFFLSYLWLSAQIYLLKKNMRLNQGQSKEVVAGFRNFANWVLDIGNDKVCSPLNGRYEVVEDDIIVPAQFCDPEMKNDVGNMIQWTYPDFLSMYKSPR
ncbi:uncharacterized protein LOC141660079 [Apium graveolens]|uniref:uncharacterized protein LOC141660079 n=1 Tax=Apium graveolens TaxID=4045 RepID=UPI003D79691B